MIHPSLVSVATLGKITVGGISQMGGELAKSASESKKNYCAVKYAGAGRNGSIHLTGEGWLRLWAGHGYRDAGDHPRLEMMSRRAS
ncbi:MAG: hypothetical protein Rhims3KO_16520 [Hyphomicrobiales bacterium]